MSQNTTSSRGARTFRQPPAPRGGEEEVTPGAGTFEGEGEPALVEGHGHVRHGRQVVEVTRHPGEGGHAGLLVLRGSGGSRASRSGNGGRGAVRPVWYQ